MKYRSIFVLLMAIYCFGCGGEVIDGYNYTASIERSVAWSDDPKLLITAEKVSLDYERRLVIVSGLKRISGKNFPSGGYVADKMEVDEQRNFVITLPPDASYVIYIGAQYHFLPRLVAKE